MLIYTLKQWKEVIAHLIEENKKDQDYYYSVKKISSIEGIASVWSLKRRKKKKKPLFLK
ncbi:MAG TPA: hypothetical protein VFV08_14740 [Puia sp.]|nr:hypothetical protein [Puia sp.]